jgi:hypothetical protein
VEEGERVLHGSRAPFIAGRGGGRRARNGETGVEKWWRQALGMAAGSSRGLEWLARSVVRTGKLTGGPSGFDIFLELSKPTQTWKLKMDALL